MFSESGQTPSTNDEVVQLSGELADALASGKSRITGTQLIAGGQTATVMAACASFGLRTSYIGAFGSDANGALARRALEGLVLWHRSEHVTLPKDVLTRETVAARIVHVDDDDPEIALTAALAARASNRVVTSDLEHASGSVERLIGAVTHPIFEERLPAELTGQSDPERALRKLRPLNGGPMVMTLAERGTVALEGDDFVASPAFTVNVVDSTGAGDVFRAGFIYALLQRWNVRKSLRFANAAAALACTRLGAIPSVPTLAEVKRLLDDDEAGGQ
jgi:sugar/nucleoside kinase (ribokinase family)